MLVFIDHADLTSGLVITISLFFVLSGFCMTYAYLDRPERIPRPSIASNLRFTWGKIKKLYPLHIVTLLFVAIAILGGLVLHRASGAEIAEQGGYFVANALLLQSWIPRRAGYMSFNAVSWYLSTSAFSYFVFPWVFQAIQSKDRNRITRLTGITLALMILVAALLGIGKRYFGWTRANIMWVVFICPLYRAGDFIIGLVTGYVFLTHKDSWGRHHHTVAEIAVILVMILQVVMYKSGLNKPLNWTMTLFWLPTSVLCIYLFAVNKGLISKTLSKSRFLVWIGDISAETYLIHHICIKAAAYLIKNKWVIAVIAFALTLTATVVWRWLYSRVQVQLAKSTTHNRPSTSSGSSEP